MSNSKIKIEMTEEQQLWLLKRLKIDWDEEMQLSILLSRILMLVMCHLISNSLLLKINQLFSQNLGLR